MSFMKNYKCNIENFPPGRFEKIMCDKCVKFGVKDYDSVQCKTKDLNKDQEVQCGKYCRQCNSRRKSRFAAAPTAAMIG
jgi:hypothetical protein